MRRRRTRQGGQSVLMAVVVLLMGATALLPAFLPFVEEIAVLSAALAMPEGGLEVLRAKLEKEGGVVGQQTDQGQGEAPLVVEPPQAKPKPSQPIPATPNPSSSSVESEPTPESSSVSIPPAPIAAAPDIPKQQQGVRKEEDLGGFDNGGYYRKGNMWLKNYTQYSTDEITKILKTPMRLKLEETTEPQVLIYHTHATESYNPNDANIYDKRNNWRSSDNNNNMVAVGAVLAQTLRDNGIGVLHDTTQHDNPSYNGSYKSSYDGIKQALKEHPSIKVVLDVHRDAIEREGAVIIDPVAIIDGEKYAQVMIISNCDDGSGLIPKWRENLRLAAVFADAMETLAPGLTRPIHFSYRKYNQQLSTGGLLLEFGSHATTLEAAKRSAVKVGEALAAVLL